MKKLFLYAIAIWFVWTETKYFGNNWTAQTPEEMICDGIALVLTAIAIAA